MKSKKEQQEYYEQFPKRLILDYVHGNKRVEAAILFALQNLETDIQNVLDIGCGIGWSSHEIAINSNAKILGIDLSKNSISTAKKLFKHPNIEFQHKDITTMTSTQTPKYDLILLIDIFEHIHPEERNNFFNIIKNLLSKKGKIILTCPTIHHQNFLENKHPENLQPVDEKIDIKTLIEFSEKTDTELSFF
ncbi:class I SAM-dependent methyltransferase [Anaerophaga thermohalophila]|uniref:class I SAM-dependent methyltransferase n=1 Tax=Anaerophaga thermohalophila TaxID=177400 RepID=UPI000237D3B0|nr:class I SAM-dependent methyltransferase [Anaerophaga thermohalophila]